MPTEPTGPLEALIHEEEHWLQGFKPQLPDAAYVADTFSAAISAGIEAGEAAEIAPTAAFNTSNFESSYLNPFIRLIHRRGLLQELEARGAPSQILNDQRGLVANSEQNVKQVISLIESKYGITIPEAVTDKYLVGLAGRVLDGKFDRFFSVKDFVFEHIMAFYRKATAV